MNFCPKRQSVEVFLAGFAHLESSGRFTPTAPRQGSFHSLRENTHKALASIQFAIETAFNCSSRLAIFLCRASEEHFRV
jgi:hypothetical protein